MHLLVQTIQCLLLKVPYTVILTLDEVNMGFYGSNCLNIGALDENFNNVYKVYIYCIFKFTITKFLL